MPEIKQDFSIWAGEDIDIVITGINMMLLTENGINDIIWRVTDTADAIESLIEKTYITHDISIDEEAGTVNFRINALDTKDIGGSKYYHELRVIDGLDTHYVGFIGKMKIYNSNTIDTIEGS